MWVIMKWTVILFFFAVVVSCQEPVASGPDLDRSEIIGLWNVESARRNGKVTETVQDAFFNFVAEDSLSTNILGDTFTQHISWRDSLITPEDSLVQYKVITLQNDTLQFSFMLQRFEFEIILVKQSGVDSTP